jgi:hypothetical protein
MMIPVSETARPLRRFMRMTTMRNTNTSRKEKDSQAAKKEKKIYSIFDYAIRFMYNVAYVLYSVS